MRRPIFRLPIGPRPIKRVKYVTKQKEFLFDIFNVASAERHSSINGYEDFKVVVLS